MRANARNSEIVPSISPVVSPVIFSGWLCSPHIGSGVNAAELVVFQRCCVEKTILPSISSFVTPGVACASASLTSAAALAITTMRFNSPSTDFFSSTRNRLVVPSLSSIFTPAT